MSTSVPQTMRAVVLQGPGDTGAFQVHQVPVPQPEPGCVLIRVRAAGLNRSELHTRLGLAEGGIACFTGMLSNAWVVDDFYPIDYLPNGID
jgi:Zn-dependent alcohol dehydrogenase